MKLQFLVVAFCLVLVVRAAAAEKLRLADEWEGWKVQHGRQYETEEEELRRQVNWQSNMEYIQQHNKYADKFGYTLAMNHFGDLTTQEWVEQLQCIQEVQPEEPEGLNSRYGRKVFHAFNMSRDSVANLPETMDWRTSGAVTAVKDQLRCGCSYAFSALAALEGVTALATSKLQKLSEQNIVDCSIPWGNNGCSCGDVYNAMLYIIENDGIETWSDYPYEAKQYACSYVSSKRATSATGVVTISSGDESSLQVAVGMVGPVSAYVDASHTSFQYYSGGIMDVINCSRTKLSHAMVIIGYGSYNGQDYWLLKNSWGPHWGIYGYIMMARNKSNQCGIATLASYPML